jgi:NADPH-dependent 7-cyano-7-deazaguanine reductase QueF
MSFSRVRVTTEEIGERIRFALQQLLAPRQLEVHVTYFPRGGIKVEVENE